MTSSKAKPQGLPGVFLVVGVGTIIVILRRTLPDAYRVISYVGYSFLLLLIFIKLVLVWRYAADARQGTGPATVEPSIAVRKILTRSFLWNSIGFTALCASLVAAARWYDSRMHVVGIAAVCLAILATACLIIGLRLSGGAADIIARSDNQRRPPQI